MNSILAMIIAFFLPGIAQGIETRKWFHAIAFFIITYATFPIFIGFILYIWGIYDAYKVSEAKNTGFKYTSRVFGTVGSQKTFMDLELDSIKGDAQESHEKKLRLLLEKYSPAISLIEKYAKKYPEISKRNEFEERAFRQLSSSTQSLANNLGVDISIYQDEKIVKLRDLIQSRYKIEANSEEIAILVELYSYKGQKSSMREKIGRYETIEEAVKCFVDYYGESTRDSNLRNVLAGILKEDLWPDKVISDINLEVSDAIENELKKRELEHFEKSLDEKETMNIDYLDTLSGLEFEKQLSNLFEKHGYKVESTPASNDYGADLILEKFGKKIVVQAKRYGNVVPNKAIQEAHTAKDYFKCDEAWIVTQSRLSRNSEAMASKLKVRIIDRKKLESML